MKRATAIIGANWGDEGKGMAVDAIAAITENPIVIRFNGGAQAGHTVQLKGGERHVFSHVGSGTFVGTPTHLSKYFIVNPTLFLKERKELGELGLLVPISVAPTALVTTPYDVLRNQWAEEDRGSLRHGSCGVGINATIVRSQANPLYVDDLHLSGYLRTFLQRQRRAEYAWIATTPERKAILASDQLIEDWLEEVEEFLSYVSVKPTNDAVGKRSVIFEGAQGLLLDQHYGTTFPYLTRSNTGLKNIRQLCADLSLKELVAIYMTRPYWTRHGAGPLPNEESMPTWIVDPTNKSNPWQGSLRYAPLVAATVLESIAADVQRHAIIPGSTRTRLGVSCLDQTLGAMDAFRSADIPIALEGHGPTRETTKIFHDRLR